MWNIDWKVIILTCSSYQHGNDFIEVKVKRVIKGYVIPHFHITFYNLLSVACMVCEIGEIIEYNLPEGLTFTGMFHVKLFVKGYGNTVIT